MLTREEALEKKFLEDRVVYLKPIVKKSDMISDLKHIAAFKMEGASDRYCLKKDDITGKLISPFRNEEEMKYFSEIMGEDLNINKSGNPFWAGFNVVVTKTPELMRLGKRFDLSNPNQNLEFKVLCTWKKEIAPDWDSRFNGEFRYAFVGDDYEEKKILSQTDEYLKIGEILGSMKSSEAKMRNFLNVYYQTKHKINVVPEDSDKSFLLVELKKLIDQDKDGFLAIADDKYYNDKVLIAQAVDKGAVKKLGVGTYLINGIATEYTYDELVKQFNAWAETPTEPIYAKIKAVVKAK